MSQPLPFEVYELTCHACKRVVTFPAAAVCDHIANCPKCGAILEIRWRTA